MDSRNRKGSLRYAAELFLDQIEEYFQSTVIGDRAPEEAIVNDPGVQSDLERQAAEEFLSQLLKHFEGDR